MKIFSIVFFIISIPLIIYGYWGAFTEAGNKVYDEMDGYYPFFLLVLGVVLVIGGLILRWIINRKSKSKSV